MRLRPILLSITLIASVANFVAVDAFGQTREPPLDPPASAPSTSEKDDDPASPQPETAQPPLRAQGGMPLEPSLLDMFWLRDKKGNLVPVLGMKLEDFEQLLRLKKGLVPPEPPAYSLDALSMDGSIEDGVANLQVAATIRIRAPGWVRVPLRFNTSVLRQATTYEGPGEHFVQYEEQGGYICWLTGASDKPHVVKLNFSAPVHTLGAQSRIEAILPRATESSLKLLVPQAQAVAELKGMEQGLATTKESAGQTEIQVIGAGGELTLLWQPRLSLAGAGREMLEVSGEIGVRVEGNQRISSDARLLVRRIGAPLESFRVRLPPGMELTPATPSGYSVTVIEPTEKAGATDSSSQMVEVKLDRPAAGAAEIRLLAALATPAPGSATQFPSSLEPARFDVLSAVRQRGTIDFTVDGDWSLSWTPDAGTRRVDVPTMNGAPAASVARFEYSQQPCGLKVGISERPTRIAVEPTYVVYVEPKLMRLEATFKYRVRGARVQSLAVGLGDWAFNNAGPESIVELESLDPTASKLMLPLRRGAAGGEFEIKLAAHKTLSEGSGDLTFSLPRPVADIVTPSSVIVVPADNVELTPKAREIAGLIADATPPTVGLPPRQQTPLAYRDLGVGGESKFAAQLRIRTRQSTVAATAQLQFGARTAQVEQRLLYRILYEPQRTFTLQVPRSLLRGDLKVLLGTEALPVNFLSDNDGESSRLSRVQVTCPSDQIGRCELAVQYSIAIPEIAAGEPATLSVPLVIPDEEVDQAGLGQTVGATWDDSMQVELASSNRAGEPVPQIEATSSNELRAANSVMTSEWRFQLRTSDPAQNRRLAVSKMWVQTLLIGDQRHERVAWRLSTGKGKLRIALPPGAVIDHDDVAIDNRRLAQVDRDGDVLVVPVTPGASDVVVEIWYVVPRASTGPPVAAARLSPAVIEGAGQTRQCYWQVCFPQREHLLGEPDGFTPELTWTWRGLFWERQGSLDQAALEQWIGASAQAPIPSSMNTYLFSAFRSPGQMQLVALSRSVILWSIGGLVLALGLGLLHLRALRQPSVLFVLAILLAAAGLSWPSSALLLTQVAAVALLVVVFAALWKWGLTGRTPYSIPSPRANAAVPESKSTAAPALRRSEPFPATTATAPLAAVTEPQP